MNNADQKYFPEYKDKKFKSEQEFKDWLEKISITKICFKDNGQDCLYWYIDDGGEILHCEPFQSAIWNGRIVDLETVKIGDQIGLINAEKMHTDIYDFEIEAVEISKKL
jgi:hypothetical protein